MQKPSIREEVEIVQGWCENCICRYEYHLGDDDGICLHCRCAEYMAKAESDLLDRLKGSILGQTPEEEELELLEEYEEEVITKPDSDMPSYEVFMGKAIRGCKECGKLKLYRDFLNSDDPESICNFCAWEEDELAMLQSMTDRERDDVIDLEEMIIENELKYNEAIERQEFIDEFLRSLDE